MAFKGQVAEANATHVELAEVSAGTSTKRAAIVFANLELLFTFRFRDKCFASQNVSPIKRTATCRSKLSITQLFLRLVLLRPALLQLVLLLRLAQEQEPELLQVRPSVLGAG